MLLKQKGLDLQYLFPLAPFGGEHFVPKLEDCTHFRGLTSQNLERIGRVDWAQSTIFKNAVRSNVFQIEDCIYRVEKISLPQSCQ